MSTSDLAKHLASNELFKSLDEVLLLELEDELDLVYLDEGEILIRQGEPGDSVFVLIQGQLGVRMQNARGTELVIGEETEPGVSVGEMSLVTGQARLATVYALSKAELVRFSKQGFDRLVEKHPQVLSELTRLTAPRWRRVQLARVLMDLLGELDTATLLGLEAELEWQQLSHGEILFRQGDPGDATYIVVNGRLQVAVIRPDGTEHIIDESGPGDIVGEFALITGEPRSASIYAIRETNLLKLTPEVFTRLLERHPHAMMQITRIIISRHKRSLKLTRVQPTRATNIAIFPANEETNLIDFAQTLVDSLAVFGPVLHLSSSRLDQIYGKEGVSQAPLADPITPVLDGWMSEQETQYRFILFEADPAWSTWTRRCFRQADRHLIVGDATASSEPGHVESAMRSLGITARTELVLLHPANTIHPTGTSEWLSQRQVSAHHHIREGERVHCQRLARRLAGQTTALVLSGGAARGFAHLGVFRALDERETQIDRMGGTSMGALLGAGYAMGLNHEEMTGLAKQFANPAQLFDYTLPFVSLMASKKVTRVVKELCEDRFIEDLWCPYFCVSSNLSRAEPVVHQTGLLWKAVRASISIPGIFSPVLHEGDILVDGGAMNNFPVDIMRELGEGVTIIGVDVSQAHETAGTFDFEAGISGWRVLWGRINPFAKRIQVPSIGSTLIRSMEVNSAYENRTRELLADILIQPEVTGFGSLDFAAYEPISEIGYHAAIQQLDQALAQQEFPTAPTPLQEQAIV